MQKRTLFFLHICASMLSYHFLSLSIDVLPYAQEKTSHHYYGLLFANQDLHTWEIYKAQSLTQAVQFFGQLFDQKIAKTLESIVYDPKDAIFWPISFVTGKEIFSKLKAVPGKYIDVRWFDLSKFRGTSRRVSGQKESFALSDFAAKELIYLQSLVGEGEHSYPAVPRSWFDAQSLIFQNEHDKPYGVFSNYFAQPVTIDGIVYPTTEHYFQSQKFPAGSKERKDIAEAPTPGMAKKIARLTQPIQSDEWKKKSFVVMLTALRAKFAPGTAAAHILTSTYPRVLVELPSRPVNYIDSFWGAWTQKEAPAIGASGQNHLGRMLMHVRAELLGIIPTGSPYDGKGDDDTRIHAVIESFLKGTHPVVVQKLSSIVSSYDVIAKALKAFDRDLNVLLIRKK